MEIVVRRSKWSRIKVMIGVAAIAGIFILVALILPLPPAIRLSAWVLGTILVATTCGLIFALMRDLPACIICEEGILVPFHLLASQGSYR